MQRWDGTLIGLRDICKKAWLIDNLKANTTVSEAENNCHEQMYNMLKTNKSAHK